MSVHVCAKLPISFDQTKDRRPLHDQHCFCRQLNEGGFALCCKCGITSRQAEYYTASDRCLVQVMPSRIPLGNGWFLVQGIGESTNE